MGFQENGLKFSSIQRSCNPAPACLGHKDEEGGGRVRGLLWSWGSQPHPSTMGTTLGLVSVA